MILIEKRVDNLAVETLQFQLTITLYLLSFALTQKKVTKNLAERSHKPEGRIKSQGWIKIQRFAWQG